MQKYRAVSNNSPIFAKRNQENTLKTMKTKKTLIFIAAMLGGIMATSLTSCGEDAVEDVLNDRLGYWVKGEFIEFEQKDSTFFYVQYKASDYSSVDVETLLRSTSGITSVMAFGNKCYVITAEGNLSLPGFYVSAGYRTANLDGVIVLPEIALELTDKSNLDDLLSKYGGILTVSNNIGTTYRFNCNLLTSEEVLRLAARLYHEDYVLWCEPNLWGG